MLRRPTAILLLAALVTAPVAAQQKKKPDPPLRPLAPFDLGRALDLYAAGRFDEAMQSVARAGDEVGRNLRRHWAVTGRAWIDADPDHRRQRLLAAAALALETENLRAERGDWRIGESALCFATCVLDWAHLQLLERGDADRAERAWYLAAAALAGGVRDWRYLQRAPDPQRPARVMPGLTERALIRFPGDPALLLEQALAAASRYGIISDVAGAATRTRMGATVLIRAAPVAVVPTAGDPARLLAALRDDPVVGGEARLRLGYLHWAYGKDEAANAELTIAAERARDPELRYLANFLLGWTASSAGDAASAIRYFESALDARPGSQSAAVNLAALELQRGDASKADAIARAALAKPTDIDPWRLFLYGHHPRLSALIADLRREVTR